MCSTLCTHVGHPCKTGEQLGKLYSAEEMAAESKKVNDFLDKKYDEDVARNPETASILGA